MNFGVEDSDKECYQVSEDGFEDEGYTPYPFDTEKISIISKPIPISTIVRRLKSKNKRVIAAEMQRDEDLWNLRTKSRLIESILLKIPLPLFYASENKEDYLFIVDGLQRISTIRSYVAENAFALQELEFLKDIEGMRYEDLSEELQIRIDETVLQFAIISADSPPEIQRNIFKRLNTGGLPLSEQEIRHALYYGPATDLLKDLAETKEFHEATVKPINDHRMEAREFVLRFIAFSMLGIDSYNTDGEMDNFLCDAMQIINILDLGNPLSNEYTSKYEVIQYQDKTAIKKKFVSAMKRSKELFGKYAFRMAVPETPRSRINKSLFEVWSVALSELPNSDFQKLLKNSDDFFTMLSELYQNTAFRRYCGQDAHKVVGVKGRHDKIRYLIGKIVSEETT